MPVNGGGGEIEIWSLLGRERERKEGGVLCAQIIICSPPPPPTAHAAPSNATTTTRSQSVKWAPPELERTQKFGLNY